MTGTQGGAGVAEKRAASTKTDSAAHKFSVNGDLAVAPLARSALAPPWPAGSLRPCFLLAGFETDTEAKVDDAEAGRVEEAPGGAQERPGEVPGATA